MDLQRSLVRQVLPWFILVWLSLILVLNHSGFSPFVTFPGCSDTQETKIPGSWVKLEVGWIKPRTFHPKDNCGNSSTITTAPKAEPCFLTRHGKNKFCKKEYFLRKKVFGVACSIFDNSTFSRFIGRRCIRWLSICDDVTGIDFDQGGHHFLSKPCYVY